MADMFYVQQGGKARVFELVPGIHMGRRCFTVPISTGRQVCIEGDYPEQVIPQLKVLFSRGGWD